MSTHRMASRYYVPSGHAPAGGLILLVLYGLLVGALLSPIYILATWYIPFVYAAVLATIGYGLLLGFVARFVVEKRHLRAPGKVMASTLLLGLGTVWLQWVFFIAFFVAENGTSFAELYPAFLLHPDALWALIVEISKHGHFTVGKSSKGPVSGFILILVWVVEAGLIAVLPAILASARAKKPYSERTGRWATETPVGTPLGQLPDRQVLRAALEAGDLSRLVPTNDQANFARATLHQVEEDPDCCFLTLEYVDVTTTAKGEQKERKQAIVTYLRILPQEADRLQRLALSALAHRGTEPSDEAPDQRRLSSTEASVSVAEETVKGRR